MFFGRFVISPFLNGPSIFPVASVNSVISSVKQIRVFCCPSSLFEILTILKEVQSKTVDVSLNGRVKAATFAEAFMGQIGNSHGITSLKLFIDTVRVTVKIYAEAAKTCPTIGTTRPNESRDQRNGGEPLCLQTFYHNWAF